MDSVSVYYQMTEDAPRIGVASVVIPVIGQTTVFSRIGMGITKRNKKSRQRIGKWIEDIMRYEDWKLYKRGKESIRRIDLYMHGVAYAVVRRSFRAYPKSKSR